MKYEIVKHIENPQLHVFYIRHKVLGFLWWKQLGRTSTFERATFADIEAAKTYLFNHLKSIQNSVREEVVYTYYDDDNYTLGA